MTKAQIKKQASQLLDKLTELKCELEDFQGLVQDESDNMEPYEGKNDLTEKQQERQEWLEDFASIIDDAANSLQEAEDTIQDKLDED